LDVRDLGLKSPSESSRASGIIFGFLRLAARHVGSEPASRQKQYPARALAVYWALGHLGAQEPCRGTPWVASLMIITSTPRARETVRILDFRLHDRDCGHGKRQADDLDYLKKKSNSIPRLHISRNRDCSEWFALCGGPPRTIGPCTDSGETKHCLIPWTRTLPRCYSRHHKFTTESAQAGSDLSLKIRAMLSPRSSLVKSSTIGTIIDP